MDMEYERLLRTAFSCARYGDPFGLADADVYRGRILDNDKHRLIFGISAALKKIGYGHDPENLDLKHELEALDINLWNDQSVRNIDHTITEALRLII